MTDLDTATPAAPPASPGLKLRLKARFGLLDELRLVPYLGHGTANSLHIKGRLLEAKATQGLSSDGDSVLSNVLTTLQRLESDEVPGARLAARFQGTDAEAFTDQEGYFQLNLYSDRPMLPGWHCVPLHVIDSVAEDASAFATARAFVPSDDADFAVVSDIDDTVIRSHATNKLAQARLTLLHDADSRKAWPGVAALYYALVAGPGGAANNPIFYVSRSGWNFYDLFLDIFKRQHIPLGPMFLRDLAVKEDKSIAVGSTHHKLAQIRQLMQLYPQLDFVLIGDTGQDDAQRYRQLAIEHPGRVRAVYLREVDDSSQDDEVRSIARDLRHRGVPTRIAPDSAAFARHMAETGLITDDAARRVPAAENSQ